MQVTLTPHGEELLRRQLESHPDSTPEQIVEKALKSLDENDYAKTPAEAVERILALQKKGLSLGGLKIKDLIEEGRKY